MEISTLNSKISLPELREERVIRLSLLEKLRTGQTKRLTLAVAGAGYGKSSLLREWVEEWIQNRKSVFWYSMDFPDRDPAVFFMYLLVGLRQHWPTMGQTVEATLNRPLPPDPEQIAIALLIELEKVLDGKLLLMVFDDYHRLDKSSKIDSAIEVFLERMPPSVHIAVSSRSPVSFSTGRLRADGKVNDLGEMDLKFQQNEIEFLFRDIAISSELRRLIERAEGWIAGLQIILQVCKYQSLEPDRFLDKTFDLPSGIYEYLAKEMFDRQAAPLQEFLLQSAILNLLVPAECDAIFERKDSARWLQYLAEQGLFTTWLQQDIHAYRYHHLLADFLRQKVQREVHPAQAKAWHHQAANYYEGIQRWDVAFEHALQAGEESTAATIVLKAMPLLRSRGQLDTVQGWLDQLSPQTYESFPHLYCHQGHLWEDRGLHEQALGAFRQAIAIAEPRNDRRTLVSGWYGSGVIYQRTGKLDDAYPAFQNAASYSQDGLPQDQFMALNGLGMISMYSGQNQQALECFRKCLELSASLGMPVQSQALNNLGTLLVYRGEFAEALRCYSNSLELRRTLNLMPGIGNCLNNLGRTNLLLGEVDQAKQFLEEAATIGQSLTEKQLYTYILSNLGDLAAARGDFSSAKDFFLQSIEAKKLLKDIPALVHSWTRLSEMYRRQGNSREALSCAQHAKELGEGGVGLNEYLPAQTALALSWLAQGRLEQAVELLDQVIETHRNTTENKYELARCLWYLAHARRALGQDAEEALRESLELAERWNYRFLLKTLAQENQELFMEAVVARLQPSLVDAVIQDLGDEVVPALDGLLASPDPVARLRAIEQLSRLGGENIWQPLVKAIADPNDDVQKAASAALENLQRGSPAPLHVTMLGRFTLRRGGVNIPNSAWGSRQAQSLFKYLLAHRGKSVNRQNLVNILWPELVEDEYAEAEKDEKANRILNTLIFKLRQTLEPYLPAGRNYSSRYLFSEGETYRLELPHGSWVDEVAFEEAMDQARRAYKQGDNETAIAHYQKAADLYQGRYLVEEGLDWCIRRQEELNTLAIEALERRAEWYLAKGESDRAVSAASRLLEVEPLHEPGYSLLMRAQYDLHLLEAALRTFEGYRKNYCTKLDVPPSEEIASLHRQIRRELRKSS